MYQRSLAVWFHMAPWYASVTSLICLLWRKSRCIWLYKGYKIPEVDRPTYISVVINNFISFATSCVRKTCTILYMPKLLFHTSYQRCYRSYKKHPALPVRGNGLTSLTDQLHTAYWWTIPNIFAISTPKHKHHNRQTVTQVPIIIWHHNDVTRTSNRLKNLENVVKLYFQLLFGRRVGDFLA